MEELQGGFKQETSGVFGLQRTEKRVLGAKALILHSLPNEVIIVLDLEATLCLLLQNTYFEHFTIILIINTTKNTTPIILLK